MRRLKIVLLSTLFFILIATTTVFAEEGGLIVTKSDQGEDVYYTVSMAQGSNINAGDLEFTYKDENLQYVDWVQADTTLANSGIFACNPDTANQRILVSYATLQDTSAGGDIVTFHFKKTQSDETTSTPVLGITVTGLYTNEEDGEGNTTAAVTPQISGDQSVAVVPEGTTIENAGDTATALSEDQSVTAEVQALENDTEEATQSSDQVDQEAGETQTDQQEWMKIAVVIILIVLVIILIFVERRKHRKNIGEDKNKKIKSATTQPPMEEDQMMQEKDAPIDQTKGERSPAEKTEADVSNLFEDSTDDKK